MTSENLIQKKAELLEKAAAELEAALPEFQRQVVEDVLRLLADASTKGQLPRGAKNLDLVRKAIKLLNSGIEKYGYASAVGQYLREFPRVMEVNGELQAALSEIDLKASELKPFLQQSIEAVQNNLLNAGLDAAFREPVRKILVQSVLTGATIRDAEKTLRQFIEGEGEQLGRLERYVGQVARDSIYQFDGQINDYVATAYGLDAFGYVGSLKAIRTNRKGKAVGDSRPQCIRWVRKGLLLISELPKELEWAASNGSGLIPGTTASNFATNRGGYNCRHQAPPVRKEVWERLNPKN